MVRLRLTINHAAVHTRKPLPGLLLADDPILVLISAEPRIVLLQSALTPAECQVTAPMFCHHVMSRVLVST